MATAVLGADAGRGLSVYRWKARVLVVSAPKAADRAFARQLKLLDGARPGLADRDLVVVRLIGAAAEASDGRALDAAAVRRAIGLPAGRFAVALIGKDGGVKLMRAAPIGPDELFATIDAMPMRQDEMRAPR